MDGLMSSNQPVAKSRMSPTKSAANATHLAAKQNQVGTVILYGIPIVSLVIESQERLCLAQISNTLLKQYSYNEIHNRRVALGITCVQCTPVQLEILRRAGAMPVSSRRCGMITRREAERLCKSFLGDNAPPRLPDDFAFSVHHECAWGCRGAFLPSRTSPNATYIQPDAANFNSWRRHMKLSGSPPDDIVHAWEDVKAMFNGGTRKRLLASSSGSGSITSRTSSLTSPVQIPLTPTPSKQIKLDSPATPPAPYPISTTQLPIPPPTAVQSFPDLPLPISVMDYVWHNSVNMDGIKHFPFSPYALPWFGTAKRSVLGLSTLTPGSSQQESLLQHLRSTSQASGKLYHQSAFRPVFPSMERPEVIVGIPDGGDPDGKKTGKDNVQMAQNGFSDGSDVTRSESVDKENEVNKRGDGDSEVGSRGTLKMVLKKEVVAGADVGSSGGYDESDEERRVHRELTDMPELSRLISMKPRFREDGLIKFREFSPNFLDAISSLKAEEKGFYTKLMAKRYHEAKAPEDGDYKKETQASRPKGETADEMEKPKTKTRYRSNGNDEDAESPADEEEDDEDEDETVDIETTDDVSFTESAAKDQSFHEESPSPRQSPGEDDTGKIVKKCDATESGAGKSNRIWTIARFSLEETDRVSYISAQPQGFCCTNDKNNAYSKDGKDGATDQSNGGDANAKISAIDCLSCCQVAFGNG